MSAVRKRSAGASGGEAERRARHRHRREHAAAPSGYAAGAGDERHDDCGSGAESIWRERVAPIEIRPTHACPNLSKEVKSIQGKRDIFHFFRILTMWKGSALVQTWGKVLFSGAIAAGVCALYYAGAWQTALPTFVHSLFGLPLSFLVVFRSNLAYQRYWAGVDRLGQIVVASRNLLRQSIAYTKPTQRHFALHCRLARQLALLLHVVRKSARHENDWHEIEALCTPSEYAVLTAAAARDDQSNGAAACDIGGARQGDRVCVAALLVSRTLQRYADVSPVIQKLLEESVHDSQRAWRGIQRISQSYFPFAYLQLLQFGLFVFIWTSPLALVALIGWWSVLVSLLLATLFFGIDEVGNQIQDPFGYDVNDLNLYAVVRSTQEDLASLLKTSEVLLTSET